MSNHSEKIDFLAKKLERMAKKQDAFAQTIYGLQQELMRLKEAEANHNIVATNDLGDKSEVGDPSSIIEKVEQPTITPITEDHTTPQPPKVEQPTPPTPQPSIFANINWEKFIGENLANKIGILITIIGVAIGVQYSIEHDLISPLMRIMLGYLTGVGLLGLGIRWKEKYENYSAVLVSGAMAVFYIVTFAGYNLYALFPSLIAFSLMLAFTAFTVLAALQYNRQVIAHIGLVSAYAIPFLVGGNSGNAFLALIYIVCIDVGILAIAFKKYWKPLYYAAFTLSWMLFVSWWEGQYQADEHLGMALLFNGLFFTLFYLIFLAYKLLQKRTFNVPDILLLLANSFIFYGIGYLTLAEHEIGKQLLGLFTLFNAVIHFGVSYIIYQQKLGNRKLFYFVSTLVFVFITIAVPVQLEGNWVTLAWVGMAAFLLWIARTKRIAAYEKVAYPLMALAFFSLLEDWSYAHHYYAPQYPDTRIIPLFNIYFLTGALCSIAFTWIYWLHQHATYTSLWLKDQQWFSGISCCLLSVLAIVLYYTFYLEIDIYWQQHYVDSIIELPQGNQSYLETYKNKNLLNFKYIWLFIYSFLFLSIATFANIQKIKNKNLGYILFGLIGLSLLIFLTEGAMILLKLRDSYVEQTLAEYYERGIGNIFIRYVALAFLIPLLWLGYRQVRQSFMVFDLRIAFDFVLYTTVLAFLSQEWMYWIEIATTVKADKLGLSIIWGIFALCLVILGIWKKQQHLRIGAIILFAVTLVKLFFYDIVHLETIAKTVVLLSLGVLLLIISFLYNKYSVD